VKKAPKSRGFGWVCWLCLAAAVILAYPFLDEYFMVRTMREWGRLAAVPSSAQHFEIKDGGTMFTREFRAQFMAPMVDIERWLDESPGTHGLKPSQIETNNTEEPDAETGPPMRKYDIRPGGGALHAEVIVDDATGLVKIYVYWS
jgi:hypothetical protein